MEMGKLTAKLRDAVPVCLLVDGKEIKRYKNIEIPDALKALEYQDFKFDVPLNGVITFKVMFEPGVLPEEFPQARARKTRAPLAQGVTPQVTAATGIMPALVVDALSQALEGAQATSDPVADAQPEDSELAKRLTRKGKGKMGAAATEDEGR